MHVKNLIIACGIIAFMLVSAPVRADFTDNGDGTVTDTRNGLIWQKCSAGLDTTTCSGTATAYNWVNALDYCEGLELPDISVNDWRLPNVKELQSVMDYSTHDPAIDTSIFPLTLSSWYWTSTSDQRPGFSGYAWWINFSNSDMGPASKVPGIDVYVRCVRAGNDLAN